MFPNPLYVRGYSRYQAALAITDFPMCSIILDAHWVSNMQLGSIILHRVPDVQSLLLSLLMLPAGLSHSSSPTWFVSSSEPPALLPCRLADAVFFDLLQSSPSFFPRLYHAVMIHVLAYALTTCLHLSTTTTTILRPFVRDYPGEPVPEETLTHPPS